MKLVSMMLMCCVQFMCMNLNGFVRRRSIGIELTEADFT